MKSSPEFRSSGPSEEPDSVVLETSLVYLELVQEIPTLATAYEEHFKNASEIMKGEFSDNITSVVAETIKQDKNTLKTNLYGYAALVLQQISIDTDFSNKVTQTDLQNARGIIQALIPEMKKWGR